MGIGMIRRARRLSTARKARLQQEEAARATAEKEAIAAAEAARAAAKKAAEDQQEETAQPSGEAKTEVVAPKPSPQASGPKPEAPRRHGR